MRSKNVSFNYTINYNCAHSEGCTDDSDFNMTWFMKVVATIPLDHLLANLSEYDWFKSLLINLEPIVN